MPHSMVVRFSPTATAVLNTGDEESQKAIVEMLSTLKLQNVEAVAASVPVGHWAVGFMGGVMVLDDNGMRVAQGLV